MDPGDIENLARDVIAPQLDLDENDKPAPKPKKGGRGKKKDDDPPAFNFDNHIPIPEQPAPNGPSPEEAAELEQVLKQKQLDKILQYRDRFKQLKSRNKVSGKSTLDELNDEIHYIEEQLGGGATGPKGGTGMVFVGAMHGIEFATEKWNPLGLRLQGLGAVCSDNIDQFTPLLDELIIKHGWAMAMSAEMRLVVLIGTTVMTVHAANSGNEGVAVALAKVGEFQAKVNGASPPEKKYRDL